MLSEHETQIEGGVAVSGIDKAKNAAAATKGGAQRIASKQGAKGSAPKVAAKSR